jgi:predicted RNase H-like nuclease (RuvC/YqgF family)
MSANRANASARNRRAGGAEIVQPSQQQNVRNGQSLRAGQTSRPGQQPQTATKPQITISDAIGLVSLRLGRLEQFMYKINHEGIPSDDDLNLGVNDRIIDEDVFRSIVSRIEKLEQNTNNQSTTSNAPQISDSHPIVKELNNKITAQQLSIYELKDMILKMQNFAMETSTSLKGLIEQYETDKVYVPQELYENDFQNQNQKEDFEPSEIIDDNQLILDGESLKEMIKNELSSDNI